MAISGSLLKIKGQSVPGLTQYKVTYSHLWKDADRNMDGVVCATRIGVYPKLELQIGGKLTSSRVSALCDLVLNDPFFDVEFYDIKTRTLKTAQYYCNDFSPELMERARELFHPFEFHLIPVRKGF
jgi:hypothetical protein